MAGEGVLATLRHAWVLLEPLEIPMALIGGLSLSAWNHTRYTRDADLLLEIDESKIDRVLEVLVAAGFQPKKLPPILQIDDQKLVQLKFVPPDGIAPYQLDLLFADSEYQKNAISRGVLKEIPGLDHPVKVLRPDDLILLKMIAGRIIDRADAAMLLRENRPEIEFDYLHQWIKRLALENEYAEIWREAFPDEPGASIH